jgi:hypothetical protein
VSFERPEVLAGRFAFQRRDMMSLSAIGNPAWETIRGVRFSMLYGPTLVTVTITQAALHEIEDVPPVVGGYLACLEKHRHTFEHVASAKHQRGSLEEDGTVIVQAGDRATFNV